MFSEILAKSATSGIRHSLQQQIERARSDSNGPHAMVKPSGPSRVSIGIHAKVGRMRFLTPVLPG